jgi:hypothetical protein
MQKQGRSKVGSNRATIICGALYAVSIFSSGGFGAELVHHQRSGMDWVALTVMGALLLIGAGCAMQLIRAERRRHGETPRDVAGADWVFLGIYGGLSVFMFWMSGYVLGQYLNLSLQQRDWSELLMMGMECYVAIYALVKFVRLERAVSLL